MTGATCVDVSGTFFFDVELSEGSCTALFDGCDEVSDFTFTTQALAASQALSILVFIDEVLGNFDSDPSLTSGSEKFFLCLA